jgi:hypothetical protein
MSVRAGLFIVCTDVEPAVSVSRNSVTAFLSEGLYSAVIRKEGYRDWTRADIRIAHDRGCYGGLSLQAALEPIR